MGHHPERLEWLHRAMRDAVEELATIRNEDVAARRALHAVRSVERSLRDRWLPVLAELRACTAMSGYRRVHLDGDDIRDATLHVLQGSGWQVFTDPIAADPRDHLRVTPAEARAIGALLSGGDVSRLVDSMDELFWLAGRMRIISEDPLLLRELRANLPDDSALTVLARLADERFDAASALADGEPSATATRVTMLDLLFASCVDVATAGEELTSWVAGAVESLDPSVAALVVRALDLEGEQLAAVVERILVAWAAPEHFGGWPEVVGEHLPADLLMPLLVANPAAATAFLVRAVDHPEIVFRSTDDRELVGALLTAGINPADVSATAAGQIVLPLLAWSHRTSPWVHRDPIGSGFDARDLLGVLVAPWLLQFGARAGDWGWTYEDADAELRWIIEDDRAMASLLESFGAWRVTLHDRPMIDGDGRVDGAWLADVGTLFDQLERAIADESVDDRVAARLLIDLSLSIGTKVARSVVKGGAGRLAAELVEPTIDAAQQHLTAAGWLPPDTDIAEAMATAARREQKIDTAVVGMVTVVGQLAAAGEVPDDALEQLDLAGLRAAGDARAVHRRLLGFVEGLRDRATPAAHNAMLAVLGTLLPVSALNELS